MILLMCGYQSISIEKLLQPPNVHFDKIAPLLKQITSKLHLRKLRVTRFITD